MYTYLFKSLLPILLEYIRRDRIAGSQDNSIFYFYRNCYPVFHSGYSILHSHPRCTRVLISPSPCQHFHFQYFWKQPSLRVWGDLQFPNLSDVGHTFVSCWSFTKHLLSPLPIVKTWVFVVVDYPMPSLYPGNRVRQLSNVKPRSGRYSHHAHTMEYYSAIRRNRLVIKQ